MLTRKQKELLLLIRDRMAADGIPPSFDEMKEALGLKSKSGIHRLITGLEERGFIKRLPHRARALEVIRLPENLRGQERVGDAPPPRGPFSPTVIKGDFRGSLPGSSVAETAEALYLPLYGRIAAGTP